MTEVISDEDDVADEGAMDTSAERETGSEDLENEAETEDMKVEPKTIDDEVTDERTMADIESGNESETESKEFDEDAREYGGEV
ncbi:hypothetical protein C0993_004848 [Termitomyces sp. T159_Od127]|nr:hypothetical protein C0993_004848 [Termitomyces sp. T159_Od127]